VKDKSTTTFDSRTRQRGCEITININCKGDVNIYNCSSPPGKGSTAAIPFASIESYMTDTLEAVEKEVQWMGSVRSNEFPDWSLSTDAFLKAFADFKALHDKQDKDTLGVYPKGALSGSTGISPRRCRSRMRRR
jgi:hypothetical protein